MIGPSPVLARLAESHRAALRAALAEGGTLVKIGPRWSSRFFGGPRIRQITVERLLAERLIERAPGSGLARLTAAGELVAAEAAALYAGACRAAREGAPSSELAEFRRRRANERERARLSALRKGRAGVPAPPAAAEHPAPNRRHWYVD